MFINFRSKAAFLASVVAPLTLMSSIALPAAAQAQVTRSGHRLNAVQRHPTLTGVAAGAATHHALKVSARRKKASGRRLNFAERHPTLTGIGAALGTHHAIKATTRR